VSEPKQTAVRVLMITRESRVSFAPEVYDTPERADLEARRWVSQLASGEPARTPLPRRWSVGGFEVRTVPRLATVGLNEMWIGTRWDDHGRAEEEALPMTSRDEANNWLLSLGEQGVGGSEHSPWHASRPLASGGACEINLAKQIAV
jgi:hypothetical protein